MEALNTAIFIIVTIVISYLIGSIPTSILIAKHYGVDIRKHGSHNAGGTNVGRVIGKKAGLLTIVLDIFKAFIPCLITTLVAIYAGIEMISYSRLVELLVCICAFSVCIGHTFPLFASFKGGKAVACFAGFVFYISPIIFVLGCTIFFIIFKLFHKVSLSSVIAVPSIIILSLIPTILDLTVLSDPTTYNGGMYFAPSFMIHLSYISTITIFLLACLVVIRHISNIKRIKQGDEPETHFKTAESSNAVKENIEEEEEEEEYTTS